MVEKRERMTNEQEQPDLRADILKRVRDFIKEQHLTPSQANSIFNEKVLELVERPAYDVPAGIFNNPRLSALETIVKYLKENMDMRFNEISVILNRNSKTIWTTYSNAQKKMPGRFEMPASDILIPASIFKDRKLGVQEALVKYLKETLGFNYHKIAVLLNRNDRTIWTVYHRTTKK